MKTITYAEFLEFEPCYLEDPDKKVLMDSIAQRQERWSALDVLDLSEIPAKDRIWAVCHEELIDAPILHEFACRCAERALSRIDDPDPRSLKAIEVKRKWLRGEVNDEELSASEVSAWAAVFVAALDVTRSAARTAARASERNAEWTAQAAAQCAERAAEQDAECEWQIEELKSMVANRPNIEQ